MYSTRRLATPCSSSRYHAHSSLRAGPAGQFFYLEAPRAPAGRAPAGGSTLRRYDLARVGRYKMNKKLGLNLPMDDRLDLNHKAARSLTQADLVAIIKYVIDFTNGDHQRDDIDHLENKRVRSVGELLQNQMRLGFLRMEKVARERMTAADLPAYLCVSVRSIVATQSSRWKRVARSSAFFIARRMAALVSTRAPRESGRRSDWLAVSGSTFALRSCMYTRCKLRR